MLGFLIWVANMLQSITEVVRGFFPSPKIQPDDPTLEDIPEVVAADTYRTAIHEAGHCVTAKCIPEVRRVESLELHLGGGMVRVKYWPAPDRALLWGQLCVLMGGIAAEMELLGSFRTREAAGDLQGALDRLREADSSGLKPPWSKAQEANIGSVNFRRALRSLTDSEVKALEHAYCRALFLVRGHKRVLLRVAHAALRKGKIGGAHFGYGKLDSDEISAIIKEIA